MKELVTEEQVNLVLGIMAVIAPIFGLVIGIIIKKSRGILPGLTIGLSGALVFGLWRLHAFFGDRFGWTNIMSLVIQIAIFAALGVTAGVAIQKSINRNQKLPANDCLPSAKKEEQLNVS